MNNRRSHLWIPDEEVRSVVKKPKGGKDRRTVPFREHGSKLSHDLQTVRQLAGQSLTENSLRDKDIVVFNVELPEKVKVQDRPDIFSSKPVTGRYGWNFLDGGTGKNWTCLMPWW